MHRQKVSKTTLVLKALNLLLIAGLLTGYLAPYVNPQTTTIPAFFGLFAPVLIILNGLFLFWWLIRRKWFFVFPLISLLAGWNTFSEWIGVRHHHPDSGHTTEETVSVLSYNVRMFDVQYWRPGEPPVTRDSILAFLTGTDAGIACFQEFFHGEQDYFSTIEPISEALDAPYVHTDFTVSKGESKHFGLATFSRYPVINRRTVRFSDTPANSGIYSDIVVGDDTVRVFNIHLESIHLSRSDYQYVSDLLGQSGNQTRSNSKIIFSKIKKAIIKHSVQAEIVAGQIRLSPYPVILCGDFNDTPTSFAYRTIIKNDLQDAFSGSGFGFGSTFSGNIPFLRIDYILYSDRLRSDDYRKHKIYFSDHFPVSCRILIPQK
jgi:endonuclease/exonuclease/phosphatase family metal-dependent hydrolase